MRSRSRRTSRWHRRSMDSANFPQRSSWTGRMHSRKKSGQARRELSRCHVASSLSWSRLLQSKRRSLHSIVRALFDLALLWRRELVLVIGAHKSWKRRVRPERHIPYGVVHVMKRGSCGAHCDRCRSNFPLRNNVAYKSCRGSRRSTSKQRVGQRRATPRVGDRRLHQRAATRTIESGRCPHESPGSRT